LREVWYHSKMNMEERSQIDGKWEIPVIMKIIREIMEHRPMDDLYIVFIYANN